MAHLAGGLHAYLAALADAPATVSASTVAASQGVEADVAVQVEQAHRELAAAMATGRNDLIRAAGMRLSGATEARTVDGVVRAARALEARTR